MEYVVLRKAMMGQHKATGNTVHRIGTEGMPMPLPDHLVIARYPDEYCFYLFYMDSSGNEMTDTFHESIEAAMRQAQFEFDISMDEWAVVE